ncbi:MAG: efflux RND transporter periplasmic adaptor subunit [Bryobacteraceae bacterium]
MRWKRWIIPVLIGLALIAALAWGLRPQPVLVEIAEVKRGPLRVTVNEEGKTRIKERYVVSSSITGRMERIDLDEGDPIRSGQVLTTVAPLPSVFLDPRTRAQGLAEINAAESRISAAQERVRAARASAEYWRAELERTSKLLKSGDIAQSRYDQVLAEEQGAAAALREAEAAVESARSEMRRARLAVEQPSAPAETESATVPVVAPVAGRVLRVIRDSAGPVIAGEPLVEIGNAQAIEVEVEVLSPDAVRIEPGTRVFFTQWGGNSVLEGTVQRIDPTGRTKISALGVEEQRVPVIAIITSPESEWRGLGAGYRVEASFVIWEAQDVLQIPGSAVFQHGGGSAVFVIEDSAARRRAIKIGRRAGLDVQVLEGLAAGERVVAHPDASIQDGTLIQRR